jgi:hypothetical protein
MIAKFDYFILAAFIVATTLLPEVAHAMYYKTSNPAGVSCENQAGTFVSNLSDVSSCYDNFGFTWAVGGTEIVNVNRITDDFCSTDGVIVVMDTSCNELYRAAHICLDQVGADRIFLMSCDDDIVPGTFGMDVIK